MSELFEDGKVDYLLPATTGVVAPATLELGPQGSLQFVTNTVPGNTVIVDYEISVADGTAVQGFSVQFVKRSGIVSAYILTPASAVAVAGSAGLSGAVLRPTGIAPELIGYLPIDPVLAYTGTFSFQESTGSSTLVGDATISAAGDIVFSAEAGSTFTTGMSYYPGMVGGPTETQYYVGSWII